MYKKHHTCVSTLMYILMYVSVLMLQIHCVYVCVSYYIHVRMLHTSCLFTLQALEHDVEAFVSEVQRLEKIAHELVSQGHFDTANINARQV